MTRTRSSPSLGILAVGLAVAFVVLPRPLASALAGGGHGGEQRLTAEVSSAFVGYWHAGRGALTPELAQLVEYWRWYHVVKAVTAIAVLVVLLVLAARLWRTYARSGTVLLAAGMPAVGVLSLAAFVLAVANIQGTLAPLSSLLSLLPVASARGDLAVVIDQVRQQAAHYPDGSSAALQTMVSDLAAYHVVVAVLSWSSAVALLVVLARRWWTGRVGSSRRLRVMLTGAGLLTAASFAVLGLANTTTALDSPMAVLNFYSGTF